MWDVQNVTQVIYLGLLTLAQLSTVTVIQEEVAVM